MLNNKNTTLQYLQALNLSGDEAKLYLELLKKPASHLELSRKTGINRTKVYRLADQLEKRSLITTKTDDGGTFLVAADPSTLEVTLVTEEERLKQQRAIFKQLLPGLQELQNSKNSSDSFSVNSYEGVEGFKQMLWHELKATGEVVVFGSGTLEALVPSKRWAEKHRAMSVEAGYTLRELLNPGKKIEEFTHNSDFMNQYNKRYISADILNMEHQIAIYNDTVAMYAWRGDQKVGTEVVNVANATMMRQMFEHYWKIASIPAQAKI
jgi:DNA-binding MarR family transcriptional regulator